MKKRILLGFSLLLFIFLMGSVIAALYITKTTHRMDTLILLHQVEILREDLIIRVQQVQSSLSHSKLRSEGNVDVLVGNVQEMEKAMDSCVGCHHSAELAQGLLGMRDLANDYKTAISRLVTVSANPGRIDELEHRAQDLGQELITMTQGMAFTANGRLQQETQETLSTIREVRSILYVTLLVGFFLSLIAVYLLEKSLDSRLRKLLEAIRRVSRGELEHRVDIGDAHGSGFRKLSEAFNAMAQDLHRSQRQLVQSAKLAAVGELAGNIAYEVNNPLTEVLELTGLLIKSDDIPAEKKEHLKMIEREMSRTRGILKKLLDFGRRKPPRLVRADIGTLIEDAVELAKGQAKLGNVKVIMDCHEGIPAVAVDVDEIKQVFLSIIDNAFFAMPGGGSLTIRCRHHEDVSGKEFVVLEFADTGIGIPEAQLDKIFDPFFTTRLEGDGTGLGLSISYMIIQSHGGCIEVESKVGEGSIFRVLLPV
ncbi:MAG TPA: ATP-binding protein [Nitrospirota bacterium]|nr:ATP-binding protein [Nitrospirota bacterium]